MPNTQQMHATEFQTRLATELINANDEHTGTYLAYQQRILLTAKQHRTLTEGWEPGALPWGNALETTKGTMDWRLFPGPLGYFLEYGSTVSKTTAPAIIPLRQRVKVPEQVHKRIQGYVAFVEKEHAKATMLITGEMWKVYRGNKWVKLTHPVKMQAFVISGDHYAQVMKEWTRLKVENIQTETFTQPELIAA